MYRLIKTIVFLYFSVHFSQVNAASMTPSGIKMAYSFDYSILGLLENSFLNRGDNPFNASAHFVTTVNHGSKSKNAAMGNIVHPVRAGKMRMFNFRESDGFILNFATNPVNFENQLSVLLIDNAISVNGSYRPSILKTELLRTAQELSGALINSSNFNTMDAKENAGKIVVSSFADFGLLGIKNLFVNVGAIFPSQMPLAASLWLFGSVLVGFSLIFARKN